jgi:hypothetical protein
MIVSELIKHLQTLPQDLVVYEPVEEEYDYRLLKKEDISVVKSVLLDDDGEEDVEVTICSIGEEM